MRSACFFFWAINRSTFFYFWANNWSAGLFFWTNNILTFFAHYVHTCAFYWLTVAKLYNAWVFTFHWSTIFCSFFTCDLNALIFTFTCFNNAKFVTFDFSTRVACYICAFWALEWCAFWTLLRCAFWALVRCTFWALERCTGWALKRCAFWAILRHTWFWANHFIYHASFSCDF